VLGLGEQRGNLARQGAEVVDEDRAVGGQREQVVDDEGERLAVQARHGGEDLIGRRLQPFLGGGLGGEGVQERLAFGGGAGDVLRLAAVAVVDRQVVVAGEQRREGGLARAGAAADPADVGEALGVLGGSGVPMVHRAFLPRRRSPAAPWRGAASWRG
jgi:hypothetical protein